MLTGFWGESFGVAAADWLALENRESLCVWIHKILWMKADLNNALEQENAEATEHGRSSFARGMESRTSPNYEGRVKVQKFLCFG
ncbi:MAG TPA: hypothetical protein VGR78_16440, partial [Verrucomicrobiae bacterium]|nr:hypothetical protein [Verrucomicrobiae bacterium]